MNKLRSSPPMVLFIVSFALFVEELLYGLVAPLSAEAPAHVGDEHSLSTLYGAYALGLLIATPILGIITDRIGRRKPMIIGAVLLGISAILLWLGSSMPMLILARILQGAGASCTWTAGLALVAEYFQKKRVRAMGYAMLGSTTGSIVGPMVGGAIFEKFGYSAAFYFAFAILAIDGFLLVAFTPGNKPHGRKSWRNTFVELRGIISDIHVISAGFAVALAAASWALMEPLFPMHAVRIAQASPATIGILFTVSNLLYAFLAPVVSRVSELVGVRQTVVIGLVLTAAVMPLLALSSNLILAGIVLCLITIGFAFTINPTSAELGDAVDRRGSKSYAVAYAIYNLAYSFGMIFVDGYVQVVTEPAHKLPLLQILLIVSGLFLLCVPLFVIKHPVQKLLGLEPEGLNSE